MGVLDLLLETSSCRESAFRLYFTWRHTMPLYQNPQAIHFTVENPVEKHFHDYDETWVMTAGSAKAYRIDRDGTRVEFDIKAGDIWMVEAGVEHGCDPDPETGVDIFPFNGSIPEGSHELGHHYMEEEGYMPTLIVQKAPLDRYSKEG